MNDESFIIRKANIDQTGYDWMNRSCSIHECFLSNVEIEISHSFEPPSPVFSDDSSLTQDMFTKSSMLSKSDYFSSKKIFSSNEQFSTNVEFFSNEKFSSSDSNASKEMHSSDY